jgi:queuine tRNA-ribosyltransferase
MPVGTLATVKAMTPEELAELGFRLILGNTYHLHLRPGEDRIAKAGGLHKFQGWEGALLTDSGGFQVFSLSGLRRIGEEGVEFQSHIDGSKHLFTPESVMQIQCRLGSDIAMVFDECPPYPSDASYSRNSMERTHRWALRCREEWDRSQRRAQGGWEQALFAICQGSTFQDQRMESAQTLAQMDFPGYAVGGLAVGEPRGERLRCIEWSVGGLPASKPRYLMGVGTPVDILDAVERGIDMFDCVLPTRNARNAQVLTHTGVLNLRNAQHADAFEPIDRECPCRVCRRHTRAYLRHLFQCNEILGARLATYHNLAFYADLMERIRTSIAEGCFKTFADTYRERFGVWRAERNAMESTT